MKVKKGAEGRGEREEDEGKKSSGKEVKDEGLEGKKKGNN